MIRSTVDQDDRYLYSTGGRTTNASSITLDGTLESRKTKWHLADKTNNIFKVNEYLYPTGRRESAMIHISSTWFMAVAQELESPKLRVI